MPRERPIVEPVSPSSRRPVQMRGIISPCKGCKNNIPASDGTIDGVESNFGPVCPKRRLYKMRDTHQDATGEYNWGGPIFDLDLLGTNPVWPLLKDHGNEYAYVFVATYEDNVENGRNPTFDTERIHCRGPFLIKGTERQWHALGHLEPEDRVIITNARFFIDGQMFHGLAEEAQVWQVARGYVREIDRNLGKSYSANGGM